MQSLAFVGALLRLVLYLPIIIRLKLAGPTMPRRPESSKITDGAGNVADYDKVMSSKMSIFYAVGIEILHRTLSRNVDSALDLAPGPGHFSLALKKYLGVGKLTGVDLSDPMIETANRNAERLQVANDVRFTKGDVTQLSSHRDSQYDLSTITFAIHHLPTLDDVTRAFAEMDRVTDPNGTVMILDLARLPNSGVTESFVRIAGSDYKKRGMDFMYSDFYESMFAAWTVEELRSAVPRSGKRKWMHLVVSGIPTLQVLIGFPHGRESVWVRDGFPWSGDSHMLAPGLIPEWWLTRMFLYSGSADEVEPAAPAAATKAAA